MAPWEYPEELEELIPHFLALKTTSPVAGKRGKYFLLELCFIVRILGVVSLPFGSHFLCFPW